MVWGFCVYFVYMIPLETDVLRKHRFQKETQRKAHINNTKNFFLPDPLSNIIGSCTLYTSGCRMKAY